MGTGSLKCTSTAMRQTLSSQVPSGFLAILQLRAIRPLTSHFMCLLIRNSNQVFRSQRIIHLKFLAALFLL